MTVKRILLRALVSGLTVLAFALAAGMAQQEAFIPAVVNATANATALLPETAAVAGTFLGWPTGAIPPWFIYGTVAGFALWLLILNRTKSRELDLMSASSMSTGYSIATNWGKSYGSFKAAKTSVVTDTAKQAVSPSRGGPLWGMDLLEKPPKTNADIVITSVSSEGTGKTVVTKAVLKEVAAADAPLKSAGDFVAERAPQMAKEPEALMKGGVGVKNSFLRASKFGIAIVAVLDLLQGRLGDIGADIINMFGSSGIALAAGPLGWIAVGVAVGASLLFSVTGLDKAVASFLGKAGKGAMLAIGAGFNAVKQGVKTVASVAAGFVDKAGKTLASIGAGIGKIFGF